MVFVYKVFVHLSTNTIYYSYTGASSRHLDNSTRAVRRHVVFFVSFFWAGIFNHNRLLLGGILSFCKTQQLLCELNINRASVDINMSIKAWFIMIHIEFWVNYPFSLITLTRKEKKIKHGVKAEKVSDLAVSLTYHFQWIKILRGSL